MFGKKKKKRGDAKSSGGGDTDGLAEQNASFMETLAKMSTDLAETRMAKKELEQVLADAEKRLKLAEQQRDSLDAQLKKVSSSFAFEQAQRSGERIKELEAALDASRAEQARLQEELKSSRADATASRERVAAVERERDAASSRADTLASELETKTTTLTEVSEAFAAQRDEAERAKKAAAVERGHEAEKHAAEIKLVRDECAAREEAAAARVPRLEGERNSYMQKCKTLQRELAKLLSRAKSNDSQKHRQEVSRLKQELQRRNRSLSDALSALESFTNGELGKGSDAVGVANGKHQMHTMQRENKALLQRLQEAEVRLQEKELVIKQLKSATHFFGEKIIELEGRESKKSNAPAAPSGRAPAPPPGAGPPKPTPQHKRPATNGSGGGSSAMPSDASAIGAQRGLSRSALAIGEDGDNSDGLP